MIKSGVYVETINNRPNTIVHYENGELHLEDSPAIKYENGDEEWWFKGRRHRKHDLPAVTLGKSKQYWKHGELHRVILPAIERDDGTLIWCVHNKIHRDNNLPAVQHANGCNLYYEHGLQITLDKDDGNHDDGNHNDNNHNDGNHNDSNHNGDIISTITGETHISE